MLSGPLAVEHSPAHLPAIPVGRLEKMQALLWLFMRTVNGSAALQAGIVPLVQDPNRKDCNRAPSASPSLQGRPCKRLNTMYPSLSHSR